MIKLGVTITGEAAVINRFVTLANDASPTIKRAMTRAAILLQRYIKQNKLSGRPGLNVQTGTLRRGITYKVEEPQRGTVVATVGTNVKYAGVHEFGFKGVVTIKAHMRQVKSRNKSKFMPVRFNKNSTRIAMKQTESGVAFVKAHQRKMNIPERSFLRSSLRELGPQLMADVEKTIDMLINRGGR